MCSQLPYINQLQNKKNNKIRFNVYDAIYSHFSHKYVSDE